MIRKYLDETYLRDVEEYQIEKVETPEEYIVFKHFLKVKEKYEESHTGKNRCLRDNGYYMIEYLPKGKNYTVRSFIDKNKKVLRNYIDLVEKSGIEEETGKLYYDDMYIDIVEDIIEGKPRIQVRDFTDIEKAQMEGKITQEEVNSAYLQMLNLIDDIEERKIKYLRINPKKRLEEIFNKTNIITRYKKVEEAQDR